MQITRIKPGGWVLILLVLAAVGFGIRSCGRLFGAHSDAQIAPPAQPVTVGTPDGSLATPVPAPALTPEQAQAGDILVSTTGTKQKWMESEIALFNAQSRSGKATLALMESRDAMKGILGGSLQPAVWSPSSPVWVYRLADLWPAAHGGAQIADVSGSETYRVLFKSPLVFLTTKEKAGFLRPLLSGPAPWEGVRRLGLGQTHAPWGAFHFAYADPLNASSGTLTMSLIISEYAREHGGANDLSATAATPGFAAYLSQVNRAYVRDSGAVGSSALEKAYAADPNSRDFITAYESAALAAVERNPDLVMIYPSPTAVADQSAVLLSAPWVSDSQKATAHAFLDFISRSEALNDGVQYYFRPSQNGAEALGRRLGPAAKAQYQASYTQIELPPYDALNEAAAQWRAETK